MSVSIDSLGRLPRTVSILLRRRTLREVALVGGSLGQREALMAFAYVLSGGQVYSDASIVHEFEHDFAHATGRQHAIAFGAGRVALYAILRASGIQAGDEVILPGFTCVVVPNAVVYAGAIPIYVDVEPESWCINPAQVAATITPRTKAIIAQHTFGAFADVVGLRALAREHNLLLIEDCAHALGGRYQGTQAGSVGHASYFTTEQSKLISTIMGGVAVTDDSQLAEQLRAQQVSAISPSQLETARLALKLIAQYILANPWNYAWGKRLIRILEQRLGASTTVAEIQGSMPGRFVRAMSPFQAAIGLQQLQTLSKNLGWRREIATAYRQILKEYGLQTNDTYGATSEPAYIRYAFLVDKREAWQWAFRDIGVELGEWFNDPIHPKGSCHRAAHYYSGTCPTAEFLADHVVNLPTHMNVNKTDVHRIGIAVRQMQLKQATHLCVPL